MSLLLFPITVLANDKDTHINSGKEITRLIKEAKFDELKEKYGIETDKLQVAANSIVKNDFNKLKLVVDQMSKEELQKTLKFNNTLLHITARQNIKVAKKKAYKPELYPIVEYLIKKGIDINAKNKGGKTPLILFANRQTLTLPILEILINNGAEINAVDNYGDSALLTIIKTSSNKEFLEQMSKYGADFNVANNNGDTPLTLASKKGRTLAYIDLLKKAGAKK